MSELRIQFIDHSSFGKLEMPFQAVLSIDGPDGEVSISCNASSEKDARVGLCMSMRTLGRRLEALANELQKGGGNAA